MRLNLESKDSLGTSLLLKILFLHNMKVPPGWEDLTPPHLFLFSPLDIDFRITIKLPQGNQ